jgi:hypothetical protein
MSKFIAALSGSLGRAVQRIGPKAIGQELAERRAQAHALGPAQVHACRRARELGELLAAAAARGRGLGAFGTMTTSTICRSPAVTIAPIAVASAHCVTGYDAFSTLQPA